jgi:nucleoside-diphosphate-sugar epimerase
MKKILGVSQNILLAGANGSIGRRLKTHLVDNGYNVFAVPRDLTSPTSFRDSLATIESPDTLVIAAGWAPPRPGSPADLASGNILHMAALANLANTLSVRRIINLSSISVYASPNDRRECTEKITADSPYGLSKFFGERLLSDMVTTAKVCHLRLPGVVGPDITNSAAASLIHRMRRGEHLRLHSKDSLYNGIISVCEIARFVEHCITNIPVSHGLGIFNFVAANPITFENFICRLHALTASGSDIDWYSVDGQSGLIPSSIQSATAFHCKSVEWHAEYAAKNYSIVV